MTLGAAETFFIGIEEPKGLELLQCLHERFKLRDVRQVMLAGLRRIFFEYGAGEELRVPAEQVEDMDHLLFFFTHVAGTGCSITVVEAFVSPFLRVIIQG